MELWGPVFAEGVPLVNWKAYLDKYLPLLYKMVGLDHTTTSRRVAAKILAATLNEAAKNHVVPDVLLHGFFSLCQDTDMVLLKSMLSNFHPLLKVVKDNYFAAQLFSEVPWPAYT